MSDCKRCGSEMTAKTSRTKEDAWECKACADKAPPKTVLSELSSEQIARIIGDEPEPKAPEVLLQKEVERLRHDLKIARIMYGHAFMEARALMDRDSYDLFMARMDENRRELSSETPSKVASSDAKGGNLLTTHKHVWSRSHRGKPVENGGVICLDCKAQKSPPSATDKEGGT